MISSVNLSVPSSWDQLTRRQVEFVAKLFLARLSETDFLTRAFCRFARLKPIGHNRLAQSHIFRYKGQKLMINNEDLIWFIRSQSYLLEVTLAKNTIPWLWIRMRRWYGPSNKCYNLTLNEYLHAESALYGYNHSGKPEYLDRLCAILYRPGGKGSSDADRRQSFNDFVYLKNARRFRTVDMHKRIAILMFYTGCRAEWAKSFPMLFKSGSTTSEPAFPAPEIKRMVRVLADGDVTKNSVLLKTPVWEAFEQLNDRAAENRKKKS